MKPFISPYLESKLPNINWTDGHKPQRNAEKSEQPLQSCKVENKLKANGFFTSLHSALTVPYQFGSFMKLSRFYQNWQILFSSLYKCYTPENI